MRGRGIFTTLAPKTRRLARHATLLPGLLLFVEVSLCVAPGHPRIPRHRIGSHGAALLRSLSDKGVVAETPEASLANISAAVFTFPGSGSNIQFTLVMSTP